MSQQKMVNAYYANQQTISRMRCYICNKFIVKNHTQHRRKCKKKWRAQQIIVEAERVEKLKQYKDHPDMNFNIKTNVPSMDNQYNQNIQNVLGGQDSQQYQDDPIENFQKSKKRQGQTIQQQNKPQRRKKGAKNQKEVRTRKQEGQNNQGFSNQNQQNQYNSKGYLVIGGGNNYQQQQQKNNKGFIVIGGQDNNYQFGNGNQGNQGQTMQNEDDEDYEDDDLFDLQPLNMMKQDSLLNCLTCQNPVSTKYLQEHKQECDGTYMIEDMPSNPQLMTQLSNVQCEFCSQYIQYNNFKSHLEEHEKELEEEIELQSPQKKQNQGMIIIGGENTNYQQQHYNNKGYLEIGGGNNYQQQQQTKINNNYIEIGGQHNYYQQQKKNNRGFIEIGGGYNNQQQQRKDNQGFTIIGGGNNNYQQTRQQPQQPQQPQKPQQSYKPYKMSKSQNNQGYTVICGSPQKQPQKSPQKSPQQQTRIRAKSNFDGINPNAIIQCEFCFKAYVGSQKSAHLQTCQGANFSQKMTVLCKVCKKQIEVDQYNSHWQQHKQQMEEKKQDLAKRIPCQTCNQMVLFSNYIQHSNIHDETFHEVNVQEEDCPVCYLTVGMSQAVKLKNCTHGWFCKDCLKNHIIQTIKNGEQIVQCLDEDCEQELTQGEIMKMVGDRQFQKLDNKQLEALVGAESSLHFCPTPDCTFIVSWRGEEDGLPECNCPLCRKSTCLACLARPYHQKMTCGEYEKSFASRKLKQDKENEVLFKDYIKNQKVKSCKRCGNAIMKVKGCLKMKCRCGYRFCWKCGVENAQCKHVPRQFGFYDNIQGGHDNRYLRDNKSKT